MNIVKTIPYIIASISLFVNTANAEDYKKTIIETSQLIYPSASPIREQYIQSERANGRIFERFHPTPLINKALITKFKEFCIKKHPFSMDHRLQEMQIQLASYKAYTEATWAAGLEDQEKDKIMAVAAALSGDDYEMRHLWALAEADALQRLSLLSFDTTAAQKKWPNSYQSQLQETLGIRPGTPMPAKRPKNTTTVQVVSPQP